MSKVKSMLAAKAEAILMGLMQPITDNGEAEVIIDYILGVIEIEDTTGAEIMKLALRYVKNGADVRFIHVGRISGFRMMTLVLQDKKSKAKTVNLLSNNGVFSYVYNFDAPDLSELGYTFFQKDYNGKIHRMG